jgi:glycosyltransferase involved in cell wall biosynthesis
VNFHRRNSSSWVQVDVDRINVRWQIHFLDQSSQIDALRCQLRRRFISEHAGNGNKAPPELAPQGVDLRGLVQEMDLPPDIYTVDIDLHPRGRVAAMKVHADVCLHPSKVEGFGMNVLECQSVGTPVVTTKFRAMEDFTRNGISVPPAQWEHLAALGGKWVMPDVKGVAHSCSRR